VIKAIETRYAGILFRSRLLEARWAVFLDEIGMEWTYEPERVSLPSGGTYLPDFRTAGDSYLEVKGAEENLDKAYLLRAASVLGHLVLLGPIPDCRKGIPGRLLLHGPGDGNVDHVSLQRSWFDYRRSQAVAGPDAGSEATTDVNGWLSPPSRPGACPGDCPYDAARSARFEHGQEGAVG
jgi:hypothetical protein